MIKSPISEPHSLTASSKIAQASDEPTLSSDYLTLSRDFALSRGVSMSAILEGTDFSLATLLNPPPRIPHSQMEQIMYNLLGKLGNEYQAGVDYGLFMGLNAHGTLGIAIQGARNLLEASNLLVQFIQTRASLQVAEMIAEGDTVRLRIAEVPSMELDHAENLSVMFEISLLISFYSIIRNMLKAHKSEGQMELSFTVPEPKVWPDYLQNLDGKVRFNQPYLELAVPTFWLQLSISPIDSELSKVARQMCADELRNLKPKDIVERLLEKIRDVQGAKPSLNQLADEMHMSVSTLQRRLKQQGLTFQQLKDKARFEQARQLLEQTQLPADEIAARLGFSDASNFTKSFKLWTGQTPMAFRKSRSTSGV
ncbi:AraC family transcriptional regulator [Parendozoicomonas haliclonae]|uniref:HTH-type transcriptional regulator VirS n=1 Tax=Parendozoicomonas haliclonae TaxID=1960125 RepID=A0A1X7AEP0_9GAMM|nr:AraC family transcriptional regulator [Parendozoicomonas haliclonae]SMA32858.1 HTH-type transcriptional regulator VirS [Parendozoicomonas haliclonae]